MGSCGPDNRGKGRGVDKNTGGAGGELNPTIFDNRAAESLLDGSLFTQSPVQDTFRVYWRTPWHLPTAAGVYGHVLARSYMSEVQPSEVRLEGEVALNVISALQNYLDPSYPDASRAASLTKDLKWVLQSEETSLLTKKLHSVLGMAREMVEKMAVFRISKPKPPDAKADAKTKFDFAVGWSGAVNDIYESYIVPFADGKSPVDVAGPGFKDSDTLLVPAGWKGHAVYISVHRNPSSLPPGEAGVCGSLPSNFLSDEKDDCFLVEVFNLGQGASYHSASKTADGEDVVQPWRAFATAKMLKKFGFWATVFELNDRPELTPDVEELPPYAAEAGGKAAQLFYATLNQHFETIRRQPVDEHDFGVIQRTGSCAMKNLMAFSKGFLRWNVPGGRVVDQSKAAKYERVAKYPPGILA